MHLLKPLAVACLSTLALAQYNSIYSRDLEAREALAEAQFDLLEARDAYEEALVRTIISRSSVLVIVF